MDRKQKEERVQRQDGKVFNIADLTIKERIRSADYICEREERDGNLTPTGHLVLFRLTPISGKPPFFVARWDGGSRDDGKTERFDLDVDMLGMPSDDIENFKNERGGYKGHHTRPVEVASGHGYDVMIATPNGVIFDATVSFTLHRRLAFSISI